MSKIFKRIAAMSAAVMMMASISSMGVSALDNTYSLYITNYANVNTKTCEAGTSHKDGWITTTVNLDKVSSGAGITYTTYVDKKLVGTAPQKLPQKVHIQKIIVIIKLKQENQLL